jgi:hypothetical protein
MPLRLAAGIAALAISVAGAAAAAEAPSVRTILTDFFRLGPDGVEQVRGGHPMAISLPGALDREILAAGAVRIATPATRVRDLFRDIESLEAGTGFLQTVRLSAPPRLSDFDALQLPAGDVQDLRRCRVGDCKLQLPQRGFDLLSTMNWAAPDVAAEVNRRVRRLAFDIVHAYRTGGAHAVGPTLEERAPRDTSGEFAQMVRDRPFLERATPGLAAYLIEYPRGPRPAGLEEYFYWSLVEFGLKKTLRLNHIAIFPLADERRWVIANRQIWASHYFQNAVEVRLLVDDSTPRSAGHYLFVLNMARPDGLTGVFGPIVRYKVRSGSRDTLRKTLAITRRRAEAGASAAR